MTSSIVRRAAVQVVTLASATLSACYYFQQAPDTLVTICEVAVNPVAIGIAVTAFALDVVKPEMARIMGDGTSSIVKRLSAGCVFAILFIASMIAVDGFLVKMRSDWAATRGTAIVGYADARKTLTTLEADFDQVAHARTTEQVQAALNDAKISARMFAETNKCTRFHDDDDRRQCRPVLDLRQEMAAAIRKGDLEPQMIAARTALAKLTPPKSADPQADALASWSGVKVDVVAYLMVAILGFAVELVACLGVWLVQRPTKVHQKASVDRTAKGAEASVPPNPSGQDNNPSEPSNHWVSKRSAKGLPKGFHKTALIQPKGSPTPSDVRQTIEAFVMTEVALQRRIESQRHLVERFGCSESTVSDVLAGLEARGLICRRMDGRCKVTEAVGRP